MPTQVPVRVITSGNSHFFGFHDLTPWNPETDEMICLRSSALEDHVPTHSEVADVVVINEASGTQTKIAQTNAWNWQMGARQRWLPRFGRRVVMFNRASEKGYEVCIMDLDTRDTKVIPFAVFDAHDGLGFGLSMDFARLRGCTPAYGYDHRAPLVVRPYADDGIWRTDLQTGDLKLILSIESLLKRENIDPSIGRHYFTHVGISPSGTRFCFLHRCFLGSGGLINNLVVSNSDGSEPRVIGDDKLSHFDWVDDERLIIWCRRNAAVKRLKEFRLTCVIRPLFRLSKLMKLNLVRQGVYNEAFREINVCTGMTKDIGRGLLSEDGHPQLHPRIRGLWVNDTYPDQNHVQTLMLYNQETNQRRDLLKLPTQPQIDNKDWRCDFHPRWHPTDDRICFDSAHLGLRQLCTIDVRDHVASMTQ